MGAIPIVLHKERAMKIAFIRTMGSEGLEIYATTFPDDPKENASEVRTFADNHEEVLDQFEINPPESCENGLAALKATIALVDPLKGGVGDVFEWALGRAFEMGMARERACRQEEIPAKAEA